MTTFCDRCGAPVGAGDQRCRTCGWPLPVPLSPAERRGVGDVGEAGEVSPAGGRGGPGGASGGGSDDPAAYGRPRRQGDPEPARRREEPDLGTSPGRPTFGFVEDDGLSLWRIALRVLAALVAVAVVALVGVSVFYLGVLRGPGDRAPAKAARTSTPRTTPAPTATPRPRATTPTPATPSRATTTTPTYPRLTLPGRSCGATGDGPWKQAAAGTAQTSCPFALAVQRAFLASSPRPDRTRTVSAISPVTGRAYPMTCVGDQPVACTGGNGALVYLFGGTATFR